MQMKCVCVCVHTRVHVIACVSVYVCAGVYTHVRAMVYMRVWTHMRVYLRYEYVRTHVPLYHMLTHVHYDHVYSAQKRYVCGHLCIRVIAPCT